MQLQKEVTSNPNQPSCKKSVQPQEGHCGKNPRWQKRNGCDGRLIANFLMTTI